MEKISSKFHQGVLLKRDIFLDDYYRLALILKKVGLTFSSLNYNTLQKATGND